MIDYVHITSALLALALGAFVIAQRKGTRRHVLVGRCYGISLLVVNGAALLGYAVHGRWGPFHTLALISIATLGAGLLPFVLGRRGPRDVERHAYFMAWSYVGLVGAGVSQLATKTLAMGPWLSVALPSMLVVAIGGWMIHRRTPAVLPEVLQNRIRAAGPLCCPGGSK
jgi:uncharacterized membrane protein